MVTRSIDYITIAGYLGVALAFAGGLIFGHGSIREIYDLAGLAMAYGGATFGLITQFTRQDLKNFFKVLKKAFIVETIDYSALIRDIVRYATIARREGIMAIEREAAAITDPFLKKALQLAVDGTSPDVIDSLLTTEMRQIEERHSTGKAIYDTLATFCPAFGMLGTIMGLVLVLKGLDDPKSIGPRMAVALLSTFYGVAGCYAMFTPIAKKLEKRSKEELLSKKLILRGIMSIQAGDGPRMVQSKLEVFIGERKS
jgi:chemotaxis protein MotA